MTPKHVAIIMDGNGRWAESRGRPRVHGHVRGARRIREVVETAQKAGVEVLTLFAFSTENWKRPETELRVLWKLLEKFIDREVADLERNNVRFEVMGEVERLQPHLQAKIASARERLKKNTGILVNFAVSYGGRADLTRAARLLAEDCTAGRMAPEQITEAALEARLWTSFLGPKANVDLLIRTSGERRVSNFMLWQTAYSEFIFMDVLWPDFSASHFAQALDEFAGRERRFGGVVSWGLVRGSKAEAKSLPKESLQA